MTHAVAAAHAAAKAALELALVLGQTEEIQWQPSSTPRPREDTTERSRGGHSDPTLNVVADDRRLDLREAIKAAQDRLLEAERVLTASTKKLEAAIDAWHGQDTPTDGLA
jgi:F0F1-type ATP synthase delta subunit